MHLFELIQVLFTEDPMLNLVAQTHINIVAILCFLIVLESFPFLLFIFFLAFTFFLLFVLIQSILE